MKLMATFISNVMREEDGQRFVRHTTVDTKALGCTPQEAKLELRRNAHAMARKLGLGKEGADWDIILAEVTTTTGKQTDSGLIV